jgi:phosphatidate cytidylyltransferase
MSILAKRVLTAAGLLAVLFFVFLRMPPFAAAGLIGLILGIAAWEWSAFLKVETVPLRVAYTALIVSLMAGVLWLFPGRQSLVPVLWIGLAWWGVAFIWVLRYPTPIRWDVGAVSGILVLLPTWAGVLVLLNSSEQGSILVLFVILIIASADIGAYFIGRQFGRTRLAPAVSPGKTWEGLGGGLVGAVAAAWMGAIYLKMPPLIWVAAGLGIALMSVVGDLAVSMFKRHAGLKDSGRLFPGHGGVLDRLDSLTAATPLFVLLALRLGIISI